MFFRAIDGEEDEGEEGISVSRTSEFDIDSGGDMEDAWRDRGVGRSARSR